jgi:hypothetical protein
VTAKLAMDATVGAAAGGQFAAMRSAVSDPARLQALLDQLEPALHD